MGRIYWKLTWWIYFNILQVSFHVHLSSLDALQKNVGTNEHVMTRFKWNSEKVKNMKHNIHTE